jgi:hypothetical protein
VIAMQNPNLYRNETFKLVPILDQCINVLGDYVDKYSGSLFNAGSKIALCNFWPEKQGCMDASAHGVPPSINIHVDTQHAQCWAADTASCLTQPPR